jgi:AcrR family transcriptional regulator
VSAASVAPRSPGRPRDPEVERVILEATMELLSSDGFGGLSIEAVAARAGVGKTTVYRRWPSKIPLVVDAIASHKDPASFAVPEEMPTRDALVRVLSDAVRGRGTESTDRILGGLVGAMASDPELADAVRDGLVSERRRTIVGLIQRGIARGEVRSDVDTEVVADLLGGPVLVRRLITGRPITARLIRQVVTIVLDGVGVRG